MSGDEVLRHWSTVAGAWESYRDRLFTDVRSVSDWLLDAVDPQPGQTLLELAAGPGETGFLVAARLGREGRLISSDLVPAMVAAARRGADEAGLDNVECRVLDAQHIDLPDSSVDGVFSRFGLMLVPDQQRAIAEIQRVLRPGGRCAYATWGLPQHNPWIFNVVAALLQNGVPPPGDPFAPGGMFSLATAEANQALAAAGGFTDVLVDGLTGSMRFDDPDDYWTYITAVAGPVAELVDSLEPDRVEAIRGTLDPTLAPFEQEGALEIPWAATVTRLA